MQIITFYIENDGKLLVVDEKHVNLFTVLSKLGIKSAPTKKLQSIVTTNMNPGTYVVDYNNQQVTFTVTQPKLEQLNVKLDFPVESKHKNKPSRDQRKEWRDLSRRHGRNTGRF